nr:TPA_asm: nucleocapsid [Cotesiavirus chinense]
MQGPFLDDMYFLISTFLIRGSSIDKISKKSTEAMVQILDHLTAKYMIAKQKRKAGSALDPKIVTLPRICATFPTLTVDIFVQCQTIRYLVEPTSVFPGLTMKDYPRALWSPMIASVIPNKKVPVYILYSLALATDNLLHDKREERTNPLKLADYLLASCKSTATTESNKREKCIAWNILKPDGDLAVPIRRLEDSITDDLWETFRPGYDKWQEVHDKLAL